MIRKASFKNFRGFQHMELSGIGAVTLIAGKNNSGKSSILEGIYLALAYRGSDAFALLNRARGLPILMTPDSLWDPLFYDLLSDQGIEIDLSFEDSFLTARYSRDDGFATVALQNGFAETLGQIATSARHDYNLKFQFSSGDCSVAGHFIMGPQGMLKSTEQQQNQLPPPPIVHYIIPSRLDNSSAVAELYGAAELKDKKGRLIEILQIIDGSLSDISTIVNGNQPQLYAKVHDQWLPLKLAGDGFDRLLLIVSSLIAHPRSILLVDEVESGFHHSVYDKFWKAVMTVAKEQQCQVIATTHSYECLESAVNAAKDTGTQDDFCYFRLGRNKRGETVAHRFSQELLAHAADSNLEVR